MNKFKNSSLSFEIKNSSDFFNKLIQEYEDFDKQHLNPRHAINCAITSWHLTDWTYHEFYRTDDRFQDYEKVDKKGGVKRISGLTRYQQFTLKQCGELEYMKLIANGSKHCLLNDKSLSQKTQISQGDHAAYDFNRHDFNVPRFEIEIDDNTKVDFEQALVATMKYWESLLSQH